MRSVRRAAGTCTVLATALLVSLVSLGFPASSSAAARKSVTVYPSHGVVDGQPVIVRWSGFAKGQPVALRLCRGGATDIADCAKYAVSDGRLSDVVSSFATTNPFGEGSENLTVAVTDESHGLAGAAHVRCDAANPCDIVVTDSFTSLAGGVRATVKFAPVVECPEPGTLKLQVGGSDVSELAMNAWGARVCQAPTSVSLGYVAKNDASGRLDYQCNKIDAAVVEYRPDYENDACPPSTPGGKDTQRPAVRLAPVTLSPVVIAFNMRNQSATDNSHIDELVLTPELLAEIFTGKLYTGQDKRIKALNPRVTLPVNIKAIARADQTGINYTLTRFLSEYAPTAYKAGGKLFGSGPTDFLANVNGLDLRTGGTAVAKAVLYPENDPRTTPWGYLGVMDASQAARYGLSTVTLKLSSGATATLLDPTEDATLRAVQSAKADRYGFFDLPARAADAKAWPMVSIGYLVPPASDADPMAVASALAAMKYILDPAKGQSRELLPAGYVPLPKTLLEQSTKALAFAAPDAPPVVQVDGAGTDGADSGTATNTGNEGEVLGGPSQGNDTSVALASVFDRTLGAGSAGSWLWALLLIAAASAAVHLVKTTQGATR